MSSIALWYHLLCLFCSHHFQWPWPYFKVTEVSNSFNWKFCYQIKLKLCMIVILLTRSWIYHYFSHYSWKVINASPDSTKKLMLAVSRTLFKRSLSNFTWMWSCQGSSGPYQAWLPWPVSMSQVCQKRRLQIVFLRYLYRVV